MNTVGSEPDLWAPTKRAKVYEALSAIADGRVLSVSDLEAQVYSSDKSKHYTVEWSADFKLFGSNDNASYFQGYLGYPIVAVLLAKNVVAFDHDILRHFANVPWKKLNTKHKNNYDKAIAEFAETLKLQGVDVRKICSEVTDIFEKINSLTIGKIGRRKRPPVPKG